MKALLKDPIFWVLTVGVLALVVGVGLSVQDASGDEPLKFTTTCIAEEVMAVTSNKTDSFELAYGADCK